MPAKTVVFSTTLFAIGVPFGMALAALVLGSELPLSRYALGFLIAWPCFFFIYRSTFVIAWNARADELTRQR
jgi:hypothetical protein